MRFLALRSAALRARPRPPAVRAPPAPALLRARAGHAERELPVLRALRHAARLRGRALQPDRHSQSDDGDPEEGFRGRR